MGLLDAEGYKFLDGSDSNSEERDRAIKSESKEVDSSVKKQNKPSSWLNQHDGQGVQNHGNFYEVRPKVLKIEQIDFDDIQIVGSPEAVQSIQLFNQEQ